MRSRRTMSTRSAGKMTRRVRMWTRMRRTKKKWAKRAMKWTRGTRRMRKRRTQEADEVA